MKHSQPLVSVVIPAYNRATRISRTLEAIINQNYDTLEIILVDDASMDDTVVTAERVLSQSGRAYKILKHETNLGVSVARNDGLKAATGKYVWFCDSDDMAEKNFVTVMMNKLMLDEADMVFCNHKKYDEDTHITESQRFTISGNYHTSEEFLKAWARQEVSFLSIWNFIFSKDLLDKYNLHFIKGRLLGQDGEFLMKAIVRASKISYEPEELYIYVIHSNRAVSNMKKPERYKHLMLSRISRGLTVIRYSKDRDVINYALSYCMANEILKYATLCAQNSKREDYDLVVKKFRHKKMREVMLSTIKFVFRKPELFFKSLMIVCFPNVYYKARNRKK